MRINNPEWYPAWTHCYVDGRELPVYAADDEAGFVWHYHGFDGAPCVWDDARDAPRTFRTSGRVEIVLDPEKAAKLEGAGVPKWTERDDCSYLPSPPPLGWPAPDEEGA